MTKVIRFLISRILGTIPVLLGVIALTFVLLNLAPGDFIDVYAAESQIADAEELARLRAQYGLDQPIHIQFLSYMWNSLTLNFGFSVRSGASAIELILERLPATLLLMTSALVFALVLGVFIGTIAAMKVGTFTDRVLSVVMVVFFAAPSFWVGLMLIVFFSVYLGWLPVSGMTSIGSDYDMVGQVVDVVRHLVLPTLALGLFYASIFGRVMRASVLEVHGQDFIQTAQSKGMGDWRLAVRHILPNAILPVVTLLGIQLGTALAGSVVIENVFSWPGIGTLLFEAVLARDLPVVTGVLFLSTFLVITANIAVDLVYSLIDPRIDVA